MPRYALMVTVALTLTTGGIAAAGDIYKWTDENGNVHYVDRPSGQPTEERLDILSSRTDNEAVRASVQARLDREVDREERRAQRAEEEKKAAEERVAQAKRQEQCEMYRARMDSYLRSTRLYREDESGERVYLDENQVMEARAKLQEKIQETCG